MRLVGLETVEKDGAVRLSGWVEQRSAARPVELFFQYAPKHRSFVRESADAFFPALLIAAMTQREDLRLDCPVSATLLQRAQDLQAIFSQWYPNELFKVDVKAEAVTRQADHANASGSFFSLGVDSFHTLLKPANARSLKYLIYVLGVEKPLSTYGRGQQLPVIQRIEQVAEATGKSCIIGTTNLRDVFPIDWSRHLHGAGLASVAHSLGGGLNRVLIPSTHPYRDILPWGSSPLTDHLWSTEPVQIVHDGAEATRVEKLTELLVHEPLAMQHLRVCTNNEGGPENCGQCNKCVRTMLTLELAGRLVSAPTFPPVLPRDFATRLNNADENDTSFIRENLALARTVAADRRTIMVLERLVRRAEAEVYCRDRSLVSAQAGLLSWYVGTRILQRLKDWYARSHNDSIRLAWRCLKRAMAYFRYQLDAVSLRVGKGGGPAKPN